MQCAETRPPTIKHLIVCFEGYNLANRQTRLLHFQAARRQSCKLLYASSSPIFALHITLPTSTYVLLLYCRYRYQIEGLSHTKNNRISSFGQPPRLLGRWCVATSVINETAWHIGNSTYAPMPYLVNTKLGTRPRQREAESQNKHCQRFIIGETQSWYEAQPVAERTKYSSMEKRLEVPGIF